MSSFVFTAVLESEAEKSSQTTIKTDLA